MGSDIDPIEDDELLFRRVLPIWYEPETGVLNPQAFHPNKHDVTGISISRQKFTLIKEAARGRGKVYFVAVLLAGDLRQRGIKIVPRPELPDGQYDLSHAELPEINASNRREDLTLERERILAEKLCLRVEGPFLTPE